MPPQNLNPKRRMKNLQKSLQQIRTITGKKSTVNVYICKVKFTARKRKKRHPLS